MLAQLLHEYQAKEIERIGGLIADGLDSSDVLKRPERLFGFYQQARRRYVGLLKKAGEFGAAQVRNELRRQGA